MTDFETLLCGLLIPIVYIMVYIAGKYDILYFVCRMLQELCDKYSENAIQRKEMTPMDDLISREALLKKLCEGCYLNCDLKTTMCNSARLILSIPKVDVVSMGKEKAKEEHHAE